MLNIHILDVVRLKDGREVTILDIFDNGNTFTVELVPAPYADCNLFEVSADDVDEILWTHHK